jgi:hypothetical protein
MLAKERHVAESGSPARHRSCVRRVSNYDPVYGFRHWKESLVSDIMGSKRDRASYVATRRNRGCSCRGIRSEVLDLSSCLGG